MRLDRIVVLRFKWFALEQGVRGKSCFGKARLSATETDIKHAKAIIKTRIVLMIELKSDRIDQYLNTKQAAKEIPKRCDFSTKIVALGCSVT